MCFSSGSSKAPPPQQPTRFEYLPAGREPGQIVAGQQAAEGKTSFGSELATGGTTPAAPARTEGAM
jgi:hypothetical protein